MKDFVPIYDRVLIKRDVSSIEKKASLSGIILPDSAKQARVSAIGTIVKCGEDCREEIVALLNKKVMVSHYSGVDMTIDNDDGYLLISDADILGVVYE